MYWLVFFFQIAKKNLGGISLNLFHYQKESYAHDFHVMKYNLDIWNSLSLKITDTELWILAMIIGGCEIIPCITIFTNNLHFLQRIRLYCFCTLLLVYPRITQQVICWLFMISMEPLGVECLCQYTRWLD